MAQAQARSRLLVLPDDLPDEITRRLLALLPHDSLPAAALVCHAFRAVISGPQFPALRQRYGGFAAPGPLIVAVTSDWVRRRARRVHPHRLETCRSLYLTIAPAHLVIRSSLCNSLIDISRICCTSMLYALCSINSKHSITQTLSIPPLPPRRFLAAKRRYTQPKYVCATSPGASASREAPPASRCRTGSA